MGETFLFSLLKVLLEYTKVENGQKQTPIW